MRIGIIIVVTLTGPMEISICTADAIHALYGLNSECFKGPFYDLGGVGQNLHRTRDPVLHDLQRPFWEKGFTPEGKLRIFRDWPFADRVNYSFGAEHKRHSYFGQEVRDNYLAISNSIS